MPGASAAQLTRTNGFSSRGELMWIACATSSLPVPVSPRSSTVEAVGATCSTPARTSRRAGQAPRQGTQASAGRGRRAADDGAEGEGGVDLAFEVAGVLAQLLLEPAVLAHQVVPLDGLLQD